MRCCGRSRAFLLASILAGCQSPTEVSSREPALPLAGLQEEAPDRGPEVAASRRALAGELYGLWESVERSGDLARAGELYLYLFRPDGRYFAAVAVAAESGPEIVVLEGDYLFAESILDLGGGAPSFEVSRRGTSLILKSEVGNLVLAPRPLADAMERK